MKLSFVFVTYCLWYPNEFEKKHECDRYVTERNKRTATNSASCQCEEAVPGLTGPMKSFDSSGYSRISSLSKVIFMVH
jgi:hypothetical protein